MANTETTMPQSNDGPKAHDIAVVGCGLMGSALARTLARSGYSVAVWNRTPERAEALAREGVDGIDAVRSVQDAVDTSRLVIACMSTYEATLTALDPVTAWNGTPLVNVASGTPEEAEHMADWATERGGRYLDGAILGYPQDIGSDATMILLSGSPDVWSEHEQVLRVLGGASLLVSEQVTAASLLDVGIVGAFYVSALAAHVEAATYVLGKGLDPEVLRAGTLVALAGLQQAAEEATTAILNGDHTTDRATLGTYAGGARASLAVMRGAGQRARLLEAAVENLGLAEEAGLGGLGFSAQTRVIGGSGPVGGV
ncbi:NAD(P)-dependent oxidoreductase [Streptomyces cinereoruber]|uniref:NAD(P)-dependent oxidoreductase n=1 Tax=Streptomyces cinereoruber TaxID=67260 RepID=UPI00345CD983